MGLNLPELRPVCILRSRGKQDHFSKPFLPGELILSDKFTIHTPINDFIAEDVRRTGIFEDLDIDACCGGLYWPVSRLASGV